MIKITSPTPNRFTASSVPFVLSLQGSPLKNNGTAEQSAFFNSILKSAVSEKDLADYKKSMQKINALKEGERPSYGDLTNATMQYVKIKTACEKALAPFSLTVANNPDSSEEVDVISTKSINESSGEIANKIIAGSSYSKQDIANAFSGETDFDKFVEAQIAQNSEMNPAILQKLLSKWYPDEDPRI